MAILAPTNHPQRERYSEALPLASENLTITWKRRKIGSKLVLITNRKSYVSFRVVRTKIGDLEWPWTA